ERDEPVLVEEPQRKEHKGHRERNRVEAVRRRECVELRGRIEEIREGKESGVLRGTQVLAREPEDRQRSARDRHRLHQKQEQRAHCDRSPRAAEWQPARSPRWTPLSAPVPYRSLPDHALGAYAISAARRERAHDHFGSPATSPRAGWSASRRSARATGTGFRR